MSEDPWGGLAIPEGKTSISARRVHEMTKWDFYWGRDSERRCLLVLRHSPRSSPRDQLPRLKGVEIFVQAGEGTVKPSLVLRLLDSALRDIFYRLCNDIIDTTSHADSEEQAVSSAVARTWRWHHLLRGGASGRLTLEEQLGLLGELLVLERYFLRSLLPAAALTSWRGPLGGAKDFVNGRTGVEAKALGPAHVNQVLISSEHQLDDADTKELFLHVSVFDGPRAIGEEGFTVTEVAERIRDRLHPVGQVLLERYNALLAAAGFRYEDDYSDSRWNGGERGIYCVCGDFPRLVPNNVPAGIAHVKYALSLGECGAFLVSSETLHNALSGDSRGR